MEASSKIAMASSLLLSQKTYPQVRNMVRSSLYASALGELSPYAHLQASCGPESLPTQLFSSHGVEMATRYNVEEHGVGSIS